MKNVFIVLNRYTSNRYCESLIHALEGKGLRLHLSTLAEKISKFPLIPKGPRWERAEEAFEKIGFEVLNRFRGKIDKSGFEDVKETMVKGQYPTSLIQWLKVHPADLVVKEVSDSTEGASAPLRKYDRQFARQLDAPFLLLQRPVEKGSAVVVALAPVEGDLEQNKFCAQLLVKAEQWSQILEGDLHLVSAWNLWGESLLHRHSSAREMEEYRSQAQSTAQRLMAEVAEEAGVPMDQKAHCIEGDPSETINRVAESVKAGLVVLGTAGRSGVGAYFIGNTAESVLNDGEFSAVIYKPNI